MPQLAMIEAFANLPDERRTSGRRHQQPLCLALFTLGVVAGNRGWIAIGDWVKAHQAELVALFQPAKGRLPSARFAVRCWDWLIRSMGRDWRGSSGFSRYREKP